MNQPEQVGRDDVPCAPFPSFNRASLDNMLHVNLHQARRRYSLTPIPSLPSNEKPNMQKPSSTSTSAEPAAVPTPTPTPLFPFRWNLFSLFQSNNQNQKQNTAESQPQPQPPHPPPPPPPPPTTPQPHPKPRSQFQFQTQAEAQGRPPVPTGKPDGELLAGRLRNPDALHTQLSASTTASSFDTAASSSFDAGLLCKRSSTGSLNGYPGSTAPSRRRRQRQVPRRVPRLSAPSSCLPPGMVGDIHRHVPARHVNDDWQRLYSTMHDGASLKTLYYRCKRHVGGVVLLIRDTRGAVFGCYVSEPWRMAPHYYGNGETFVWSVVDNKPQVHRWSRANSLFQLACSNSLALGGGPAGGFALFVDSMLERGASRPCSTFNSPCLASAEQFDIVVLEAYGLVAPRHLG